MDNKLARSIVVTLGETLNEMPPFLCGRQVAGLNSLPVVVAQTNFFVG